MRSTNRFVLWLLPIVSIAGFAGTPPAQAREVVSFTEAPAGTIVVRTSERRLYYVTGEVDLDAFSQAPGIPTARTSSSATNGSPKTNWPP